MVLESREYGDKQSFITLTYSPENVPNALDKTHLQKFLKRLRKYIAPVKVRYFAVGEYGDQTWRPHYHLILFGLDPIEAQEAVQNCWSFGFVQVGTVTKHSISYCASYVSKKLTKAKEQGLEPEFALMSRNPGIGHSAVKYIAEIVADQALLDVPTLKIGDKDVFIPSYIAKKVRELVYSDSYRQSLQRAKQQNNRQEIINLVYKYFGIRALDYNEFQACSSYEQEYLQTCLQSEKRAMLYTKKGNL